MSHWRARSTCVAKDPLGISPWDPEDAQGTLTGHVVRTDNGREMIWDTAEAYRDSAGRPTA